MTEHDDDTISADEVTAMIHDLLAGAADFGIGEVAIERGVLRIEMLNGQSFLAAVCVEPDQL